MLFIIINIFICKAIYLYKVKLNARVLNPHGGALYIYVYIVIKITFYIYIYIYIYIVIQKFTYVCIVIYIYIYRGICYL